MYVLTKVTLVQIVDALLNILCCLIALAEPESELVNLIWTLLEVTGSMIGLWLLCVGLAKIFTATFYK